MDAIWDALFGKLWSVVLVVSLVVFGLAELGYRVGLPLFSRKDEARRSQIGGVQGAVLGLLGLLLGFTFAMAVSRYDTRRALVVDEANAIGTTWLRAGMLSEPHRSAARDLLRQFVDVRIKYEALSNDSAKLAEGLQLSATIEKELWKHAEAAAKEAPTPITNSFVVALNEMIDTDANRVATGRNQIPSGVWVLVVLVAGVGCFTSSYGSGAQGARSAFTSFLLPGLIMVVIGLIFDLTHSREGFIDINQQAMLDLQQFIASGL